MDTCAIWIQAIANVILVLVTFGYVRHTKKLVEDNNKAFLSIEKEPIVHGMEELDIIVVNYGPDHALNVKVKVEMWNGKNKKYMETEGPRVLAAGKESTYRAKSVNDYNIQVETPIVISYNTLGGKEYKYKWLYRVGSGDASSIVFIGNA